MAMEFIKDNKPLSPRESGEIMCNVLDDLSMPFVRYNLKDIGWFTSRKCSCGMFFPLMEMLDGRSYDFVFYENELLKSPRNFLGLFEPLVEYLQEYQIVQKTKNSFMVRIVPKNHFREVVIDKIKKSLRVEFPNARVDVEKVDVIEREKSGKLRAFKSLVKSC